MAGNHGNENRLALNLNLQRDQNDRSEIYPNDRTYQASSARVYPTTPSTFPQPVYSQMQGQEYGSSQSLQSPNQGYFQPGIPNTQYHNYNNNNNQQQQQQAPQTQQPQQYHAQYQQQYQPRNVQANDPNSGLAHQFSNQNLGPRQGNYGRPSPLSGAPRGIQSYGSSTASSSLQPQPIEDKPPEQDGSRYSANIGKRVIGLHLYVEKFFTENIQRARDRNTRAQDFEAFCGDPRNSDGQKHEYQERLVLRETDYLRRLRTVDTPKQYATLKIIGKGAFGEVKLVQRKSDSKIFALKCLVKAEMFKKDQLAHVRAERDILAEADSPWVVKLYNTFQDKAFLYMLMEFLPGGDLMTMLIKYETFAPDIARFYMAEILMAIEAVHSLGFIHRDIKPDNILLDISGHLKLTDFGLSTGFHKQHEASYYQNLLRGHSSHRRDNRNSVNLDQINLTVSNRGVINNWRKSRRTMAYSTVGTPDYIAPEIFGGHGYSFSCDWWSLGAIMYESVVGWPPFCADDPHDTYRKIVNWRQEFYFPDDGPALEPEAESLIRALLCDAPNRLGHNGGMHGATEIKQHPYFAGVDWANIRGMGAPFRPALQTNTDTTYFPIDDIDQTDTSAMYEAQAAQLSEEHAAELTIPFIGYTYKRY